MRALGARTLLSDEFPGVVGEGTANVSVDGVPLEVTNEDTVLRVGGVKLDVIATLPLSPDSLDGIDLKGQLFMAAHRWALESATPVTLRTGGAKATVLVATPAALVAMKLHALQDRRSGTPGEGCIGYRGSCPAAQRAQHGRRTLGRDRWRPVWTGRTGCRIRRETPD